MIWRTKSGDIDLGRRALVMGILNVTADSFSDGGKFLDAEAALAHAHGMVGDGAAIIDIGGESTRPGAEPVPEETELAGVLPVIKRIAQCGLRNAESTTLISIDTCKPRVAREAIAGGADIINDVTGLRDPAMIEVARETGAGVIAMHMQGTPRTMQRAPHYDDVVAEVRDFFRQTFARAVASGIDPMSIAFDPGIGFGKTVAHNLMLLKNLASLRVEGRPLVLGVSRKSFIGKVLRGNAERETRNAEAGERLWPTVAITSFAREHGANILRVHDVKANVAALRMTEAILQA